MVTSLFVVACFNSMVVRPVQHIERIDQNTLTLDVVAWIVGGLLLNLAVFSNLRTPAGGAAPSLFKRLFFSLVGLCIVGLIGVSWTLAPLMTPSCNFDLPLVALLAVAAMLVFSAQAVLFQLMGNRSLRGVVALVASSAMLVGVMNVAKDELAFPTLCPPVKAEPYVFDNSGY